MIVIDTEGEWADQRLSEEPVLIFFAVNDIDSADEKSAEEEAEDANACRDATTNLATQGVTQARKDNGAHEREGSEIDDLSLRLRGV